MYSDIIKKGKTCEMRDMTVPHLLFHWIDTLPTIWKEFIHQNKRIMWPNPPLFNNIFVMHLFCYSFVFVTGLLKVFVNIFGANILNWCHHSCLTAIHWRTGFVIKFVFPDAGRKDSGLFHFVPFLRSCTERKSIETKATWMQMWLPRVWLESG